MLEAEKRDRLNEFEAKKRNANGNGANEIKYDETRGLIQIIRIPVAADLSRSFSLSLGFLDLNSLACLICYYW